MPKIVKNDCFGGFGLSHEAIMLYAKKAGIDVYHEGDPDNSSFIHYYTIPCEDYHALENQCKTLRAKYGWKNEAVRDLNEKMNEVYLYERGFARDDPFLVQVVEELGSRANGQFAKLVVVDVPDSVQWEIDEYDGLETIREAHQTW